MRAGVRPAGVYGGSLSRTGRHGGCIASAPSTEPATQTPSSARNLEAGRRPVDHARRPAAVDREAHSWLMNQRPGIEEQDFRAFQTCGEDAAATYLDVCMRSWSLLAVGPPR